MHSRFFFTRASFALLSVLFVAIQIQAQSFIRSKNTRAFHAPVLTRVDRVELLSIDSRMGEIQKVNETKSIDGNTAQPIADVWRAQKLTGWSAAACHEPPFAIKFYSKGKVVLFATICWACSNITFIVPNRRHWVAFQARSLEGQRLKDIFINAFPKEPRIESGLE
ncbi:MAG: hypothetical protein ACREDR_15075 [Blastocatellia bacterium]